MKRTITDIVVHCSASPNGKAITARDIDSWHKARKFKRSPQAVRSFNPELKYIGYHFIIEIDGRVVSGRSLEEIGAHVQGNNSKSIGICMVGTDQFSEAQFKSLATLIAQIACKISNKPVYDVKQARNILNNLGISIKGHRDYSPDLNGDGQITRNEWIKICPGFSVSDWLDKQ